MDSKPFQSKLSSPRRRSSARANLIYEIQGHPDATFDGLYSHSSDHNGSPVLKSERGMYCYRNTPEHPWLLNDEFTPYSDACVASCPKSTTSNTIVAFGIVKKISTSSRHLISSHHSLSRLEKILKKFYLFTKEKKRAKSGSN